jgi:predicted RND superfamily exporter protein
MSLGFGFVAIYVSTFNLLISIVATTVIGMIITNVLVLMPLLGWELGSSESVAIVICVGSCIDYVVHLAAHYTHSKLENKEERIRESLREMGVSIVGGGSTTILASLPLFLCVVTTYIKFASFVMTTMILAVLFALFLFTSICLVICHPDTVNCSKILKKKLK